MDICWFFSWIFFIDQIFAFVKVVLGPHAALSCSYSLTPSTLSSSRRPPSVGRARIIEVIKVVEHKVHILLLFSLQMMYNPLIFVHFYPNMRISLSWDSSWLLEFSVSYLIFRMVAPLSRRYILLRWHRWCVLFFLTSPHRLVIEFPALFLELIITHIKSVSAHAMIPHFALNHIIVVSGALAENWLLLKPICRIIIVNVMWVIFWVWPRLLFKLLLVILLLRVAFFTIWIVVEGILATLEGRALVFLRNGDLLLLLRGSIKIAWCCRKFLHVNLLLTVLWLGYVLILTLVYWGILIDLCRMDFTFIIPVTIWTGNIILLFVFTISILSHLKFHLIITK